MAHMRPNPLYRAPGTKIWWQNKGIKMVFGYENLCYSSRGAKNWLISLMDQNMGNRRETLNRCSTKKHVLCHERPKISLLECRRWTGDMKNMVWSWRRVVGHRRPKIASPALWDKNMDGRQRHENDYSTINIYCSSRLDKNALLAFVNWNVGGRLTIWN